ncbi:MAG: YtxH domain-containing protein, partial [Gemmatimonadales bacterium]
MRRELDDDRAVIVVEGGGGVGPFLWGLVAGAALAFLLAPQTGEKTRAQLKRKWGDLRTLAEEKAEDLREL